jgi:hypothetical protein
MRIGGQVKDPIDAVAGMGKRRDVCQVCGHNSNVAMTPVFVSRFSVRGSDEHSDWCAALDQRAY